MTALNVNLSGGMRSLLDLSGVYAYAVYFDPTTGTTPVWLPISLDGALQGGGTGNVALNLPSTFSGGKVYFLIQSDDPATHTDLQTAITQQSDINWNNAATWGVRYDSFEVTLTNGTNDVGNLTSVEGFGLPMDLSVTYSNGTTATRGYASPVGGAGNNIWTGIGGSSAQQTVYDFAAGTALNAAGYHRAGISPTQAVGLTPQNPAFSPSDWNSYIQSLESTAASDIAITGFFNGAKDSNGVYHNGGFFSYQLEWDASQGVFWLNPTATSQIKGYIRLTPDDLANSIYSTLGNVQIYESKTDTSPYIIYMNTNVDGNPADMNTGVNNQWGKVLSQFLTGFTAGFYGMQGQSANADAAAIDLNKNWNWDPTYSFGNSLQAGYTPIHVDEYSKVFFYNSNSYGSGYSDSLMSQYSVGGPLLSVYDPGTNADVAAINITLYADNEASTGYVPPVIYNHIGPAGAQYDAPQWVANTSSVTLNFFNSGIRLDDHAPIYFEILTGYNTSGVPQWAQVQLGGGGSSPWQLWNISLVGDQYVATAAGAQTEGSLLIGQFPTAVSGTSWYRIVVGEGDAQKTYNLYLETNSSGEFENAAGSIAIDGLASITPGATNPDGSLHTFSINFMPSSTLTFDPALVEQYADFNYNAVAPNAPVAGTLEGGTFTAFGGQASQVSNAISVTQGEMAFGWTGNNNDAGTPSWISGLTNKINGLNIALLSIASTSGTSSYAPIAAEADVDGQWTTAVQQQLGNGTYNITMKEYAPSDTTFSSPLTGASSLLTVTVAMSTLALHATAGGTGIQLADAGDGTAGNWLSLSTVSSSLPPEATLLLYATDSSGQMLGRDGLPTTDLNQAVLAYVGSVENDQGTAMLQGHQSVYLGVGQQLHFAIQTHANTINDAPAVNITQHADGSLGLNVGGVQLNAASNNVLSGSAEMAAVQRMYDLPLVYLQNGQQIDVEVAGSAANTNHLSFVRFDVNFDDSVDTSDLSVGGVAYGNTAEFHAALLANTDTGYGSVAHGGGNFHDTTGWIVGGASGFYVPVLVTQSGEIFVPGTGNTGGAEYIRMFGENTFGFEDLSAAQGSDFDYNDMVMKLTPHDGLI